MAHYDRRHTSVRRSVSGKKPLLPLKVFSYNLSWEAMSGTSTVGASAHLLGVKCIGGSSNTLGTYKNPTYCLTNLLLLLEKLCENDSAMPDIFAFQEYDGDCYI